MSLAKPDALKITITQKVALGLGLVGLLILSLALFNVNFPNKSIILWLTLGVITIGTIIYSKGADFRVCPFFYACLLFILYRTMNIMRRNWAGRTYPLNSVRDCWD